MAVTAARTRTTGTDCQAVRLSGDTSGIASAHASLTARSLDAPESSLASMLTPLMAFEGARGDEPPPTVWAGRAGALGVIKLATGDHRSTSAAASTSWAACRK